MTESAPEKKSRKARKAKYEDEYEQYKAARAAPAEAVPSSCRSRQGTKPVFNPADPFAEWEKANAKVESQQRSSPAARAAGITPSGQYTAPRRPVQATQGTPARPGATTVRPSCPGPCSRSPHAGAAARPGTTRAFCRTDAASTIASAGRPRKARMQISRWMTFWRSSSKQHG